MDERAWETQPLALLEDLLAAWWNDPDVPEGKYERLRCYILEREEQDQ
jgi:hypothetical protein